MDATQTGIVALSGIVLAFAGLAHLDYRPKSAVITGLLPATIIAAFGIAALLGQEWAEVPWFVGISATVIGGIYNIKLTYKRRPAR